MEDILRKNDLKLLPSRRHYDQLENPLGWCEQNITELEGKLKEYIEDDSITKRIVSALCNTSYKNDQEEDCIERCAYLFYWIGDMLFDKKKDPNTFSKITPVLSGILNKFGTKSKCKCNFPYTNINEQNFNEMKLAYFYYKDYTHFEERLTFYNKSCDKYYKQHLEDAVNAYNNVYETCKRQGEVYCSTVREVASKLLGDKYDTWKCENIYDNTEVESQGISSFGSQDDLDSSEESSVSTAVILISLLLPFLGIVFYLLYKFTPVSLFLRSYLVKKQKIQRNINDEELLNFLFNEYESTNRDAYGTGTHIRYHCAENIS
ncbi:PIR Superfamily Protein [Plasmodium ovale curtisi]|uniref:PIR Superfamily Protein n=1 Tax=Plasmodium ovale curtisi TaxID=864141 RepID=A0A1A8WRQ3_PLAOA|nr:PIR Superfamily Protein [Plasmodium ovale curtisi]